MAARSLTTAFIDLAVKRAISERSVRRKMSDAEKETLKQTEGELYQQTFERYSEVVNNPSEAAFKRLWKRGLRDELMREHLALGSVKSGAARVRERLLASWNSSDRRNDEQQN